MVEKRFFVCCEFTNGCEDTMQLASHYSKSQLKLSFASCSILPMHKLDETIKLEVTHLYTGRELTGTQNVLLDKEHTSVKDRSCPRQQVQNKDNQSMNFPIEHPELPKSAFMDFPNMSPLSHHYGAYYPRCGVGAPRSEYPASYSSRMNFPLQVNHLGPAPPPTSHAYLPYVPRELYEGKFSRVLTTCQQVNLLTTVKIIFSIVTISTWTNVHVTE